MFPSSLLGAFAFASIINAFVVNNGTSCYLYPESLTHFGQPVDDSQSIQQAFELCGVNGTVIFTENVFHVDQVMNTTNLRNVDVHLYGDVFFSTNVPYWLSHSFNVSLQNQSTAWLFGGTNVSLYGKGGSLNGNGQTWYTENKGNSNQPGRPITITIFNSTNIYIDSLNITQPQFWATFVTYSRNVTMTNIYVNATSNDHSSTVNTDGIDTWLACTSLPRLRTTYASPAGTLTPSISRIGLWSTVMIAWLLKQGNTTNLFVQNVTCYGGNGMTIGSVGQYPDFPDYDQNITFQGVQLINSTNAAYIKTWQGSSVSTTGNGDAGGGGSGLVKNITFRDLTFSNVVLPLQITQCIYTEGTGTDICETSKMQVENVLWQNITGTTRYNVGASIHCAASHPCPDIYFKNVNITSVNQTLGLPLYNTTLQSELFQCANIINENTTSGIPCNHWAPDNFPQSISANVR
ncbi:glycoside hydrolase family 28 protein [Baudoinia panamericana UAMH 10762]|uniref:galacturonan 1,4-alpha-galacturonidase n=1 Tax=Baudoinia panamericana (strain UAMH 10762) TaxID=717646 RepID=M2MY25_BAUPA|nr:glycoside hydrolase family 28 protein [Baudoinia panamericana UAMH 10762]EMC96468.1 glycoside hydrolase family 28 protein [Baudoinia panamericana UAMH 10762]